MRGIILSCLFLLSSNILTAQSTHAPIHLLLKDLTPKFLSFYQAASSQPISEEERWALWKKMYDFAATPPTPQGDSIARELLKKAWTKYSPILPLIEKGGSAIKPEAEDVLRRLSELLRPDSAINITLLIYVGGFEGNAFTTAQNNKITTSIAIETPVSTRGLLMTHELTHAVHIGMGSFSGGWRRSIGTIIVTEGLAMHVTKKLFPGLPDRDFTDYTPGWLKKAGLHRTKILKGILPYLSVDSSDVVMRFTMGKGSTGLEREAYYAGWEVVKYWLNHGMKFKEIARIPEKDMPQKVSDTIKKLLQNYK